MIHIIQIVPALAPEYGGPARSVPNLCLELAKLGTRVTILYSDLGEKFHSPNLPVHPNLNYVSLKAKIIQGVKPVWIPNFKPTLHNLCDGNDQVIIHDHGIWLPHNGHVAAISDQLGIPLIVSPRGMLQPWALRYRRWRKKVAWIFWQKSRLQVANLIHAASGSEAEGISKLELKKPVVIVPNGTAIPDLEKYKSVSEGGKCRMLFLSRIHPSKGLLNLISALSRIESRNWSLNIAGYDENNHQQDVERAVTKVGLTNEIQFIGPVENDRKWEVYSESDLFVHPSFSENFGIVVAEALASGLPVITTTGTPWAELDEFDCGWWVNPNVEDLSSAIEEALNLSDDQRQKMGARGKKLIEKKYSWKAIALEMQKLYQLILTEEDFADQEIIDLSPKIN